jgi:hypothetical protein
MHTWEQYHHTNNLYSIMYKILSLIYLITDLIRWEKKGKTPLVDDISFKVGTAAVALICSEICEEKTEDVSKLLHNTDKL